MCLGIVWGETEAMIAWNVKWYNNFGKKFDIFLKC